MAERDIIMANQKELKRLHVVHNILEKKIRQVDAAEVLDLGDRQIRRIVKNVRSEGDKAIVHKLRGKSSNRAMPKKARDRIINIYKNKYHDFGPLLATEKLFEIDKIRISDETLRKWLITEGLWQTKRKRRKHRKWRERKHHYGQMIQLDGSEHDWFEGRGPECVLMGYIDDATGKVFARFYTYEGTLPAMDSLKRYIKRYGLPQSIYLDKHTTYKSNAKRSIEDQLNNNDPLSQFGRAARELGIDVIYAHSAQAKGRIERLFKTFQDRLIKEMRLEDIRSIDQANKFLGHYLPIYNRRFAIKPAKSGNLHRSLPKNINLDKILCRKTDRALRNDFTIRDDNRLYQILDHTRAKKVTLEERTNGCMLITYKGKALAYKPIFQKPVKQKVYSPRARKYTIAQDHPWKSFKINTYPQSYTCSQKEKSSKKEKELLLTTA